MIGRTISHYHILEKIGSGGMGEVFLAEDTKLKRQVALKFLPRQMTVDPEAKERFEREAQAAAALNHPNIVTVYEIGEHEGQVFIAMEYVEGKTLKEMISGSVGAIHESPLPITHHPLPITQVIDLATQIASGLAIAHEKGIVHRDIKPQNILIDNNNHVKILDFGLAKLKGVSSLTKESSTLGTVHYMSPEQTMGKEVDHRTDIWSLGVVLYEMLTGKLPFKGDYEQAVIYSILNEEPKKATEIRQDIPPEFDRIIEKALAKEPAERYQHADDLLVDLKRFKRDSRPDRKPAPAVLQRKSRHWMKWAIPGAVILFVLIAAALFFTVREKAKPGSYSEAKTARPGQGAWSHSIAVLPFKNLSDSKEDEYFSDGITDDIIAQLSKISDLKVISRTSVMRFKRTSKSIPEIGSELNVGTVLEGSVRHAGNQVRIVAQLIDARNEGHLWADTYDKEMTQIFAIQSDVAQRIASALKARLSPGEKEKIEKIQTENTEAYQLYLKGRFYWNKRNGEGFEKAIQYFNKAIEMDPSYALAYSGLADAYITMGAYFFLTPKESKEKTQVAARKALALDGSLAEPHSALASLFENGWDWANAEKEYQRALELNPNYATGHQWYGEFLSEMGRFDEGLIELRKAQELDPLSPIAYVSMAIVVSGMHRYDEGIQQVRKAFEIDQNFSRAHSVLGILYLLKGKGDAAIQEHKKAIELSGNSIAPVAYLGCTYGYLGRKGEAEKILREFLQWNKQQYISSYLIGTLYLSMGEKDQAFVWFNRAIERQEPSMLWLKFDLAFDPIRKDPRFIELMKKMRLPL